MFKIVLENIVRSLEQRLGALNTYDALEDVSVFGVAAIIVERFLHRLTIQPAEPVEYCTIRMHGSPYTSTKHVPTAIAATVMCADGSATNARCCRRPSSMAEGGKPGRSRGSWHIYGFYASRAADSRVHTGDRYLST